MQSRLQQGSAAPRLSRNRRMCKSLINKDFQDQAVRNCTKSTITPRNTSFEELLPPRFFGHMAPDSKVIRLHYLCPILGIPNRLLVGVCYAEARIYACGPWPSQGSLG